METSDSRESPLEAAAGAAGPHAIDAFELLSNETRLAILLALWEWYDPTEEDNAVSFSELYDRVGISDSGNFTYHLDKLTDHYVAETGDGYELREAGHLIIRAVIAGRGLGESSLPPTEIDMSCYHCGASVELSYANESLYLRCTECEGTYGPEYERVRTGTLTKHHFNPAGLARRTPGEAFVAGTTEFLKELELQLRGICPECSGSVDESVQICQRHEAPPGKVCPACGTRYEVSVRYVCSVCKHRGHVPAQAAVHDHPAVVAFCYDQGVEQTFDLEDSDACGRLWEHLFDREYSVVSHEPLRIHVTVPGNGGTLQLTLDGDLNVTDVSRTST